jgi:hypothetical protein
MSFRRNRERSLEWHKWVEAHKERLIAIGIPREVWEDPSVWQRFLWHGYSSDPSHWRNFRFSIDDLDEEHLRLLHEFLITEGFGPNCYGSTVWDHLQRRFDRTTQDAENSVEKK